MTGASRRGRFPQRDGGGKKTETYGVAMTLMLCFFVMLFASGGEAFEHNRIPLADPYEGFENLREEIPRSKSATDSIVLSQSEVQAVRKAQADFRGLVSGIESYMGLHGIDAELEVDYNAFTVLLRFPDSVFFTFAQAELLEGSYPVLNHLLTIFEDNAASIDAVSVEAHTDDRLAITSAYDDNRALSAERALAIVRYFLQSRRIDGAAVSAVGHGESRPMGPNDGTGAREVNRRLEFLVSARAASIDFWRNTGQ